MNRFNKSRQFASLLLLDRAVIFECHCAKVCHLTQMAQSDCHLTHCETAANVQKKVEVHRTKSESNLNVVFFLRLVFAWTRRERQYRSPQTTVTHWMTIADWMLGQKNWKFHKSCVVMEHLYKDRREVLSTCWQGAFSNKILRSSQENWYIACTRLMSGGLVLEHNEWHHRIPLSSVTMPAFPHVLSEHMDLPTDGQYPFERRVSMQIWCLFHFRETLAHTPNCPLRCPIWSLMLMVSILCTQAMKASMNLLNQTPQ